MKVAIISHYKKEGVIPYYVRIYLLELKSFFEEVVLALNHRTLENEDYSFLRQNKIKHFFLDNEGFDFGMWKKTIRHYTFSECDFLCLCNDSCIPVGSLKKVLEDHLHNKNDLNGVTDSYQINYHIQSYFLTFKNIGLPFVMDFLDHLIPNKSKEEIINDYEIGLTQMAKRKGLLTGVSFPTSNFEISIKNPCYAFALQNLSLGCPLIKRRLVFKLFSDPERKSLSKTIDLNFDYKKYLIEHVLHSGWQVNPELLFKK